MSPTNSLGRFAILLGPVVRIILRGERNFLPPGYLVQTISVRLMLETYDGESADALVFATDCIKEWDIFFEQHGLT